MVAVAARLDLERRVVDGEVRRHAAAELVEQRPDAALLEALVGDRDVRGQHRHAAGDRPGVQVVHVDDAGHATEVLAHVLEIQVRRRRLEQHVDRLAQQPPRPRQDQDGDQQRGERVRAQEAGGHDDQCGDDDEHRAEQVAEHLEVGAPHVQRLLAPVHQQQQRDGVGDQADGGEPEHRAGLHLRRVDEPQHTDDCEPAAHPEEHQRVDESSEDLGAVQPEGPPRRRRHRRDVRRRQRDPDRGRVGDHVTRVGEQRQGARDPRAHELDHDDHEGHREHQPQARPVHRPALCVVVTHDKKTRTL